MFVLYTACQVPSEGTLVNPRIKILKRKTISNGKHAQFVHNQLVNEKQRQGWSRLTLRGRDCQVVVHLFVGHGDRGVVVQPLCHQLQGQRILGAARLLDLGPLVLEPYLYLGFIQA